MSWRSVAVVGCTMPLLAAPQQPAPGGTLLQGNLESWETVIARAPELFSSGLISYRDTLQEQHRLLTRHLNR